MRNISRRVALKGATAVAASAAAMTAVTATASIAGTADSDLLALADEHAQHADIAERWYETAVARLPAHLRNVFTREANRALAAIARTPEIRALYHEGERHIPVCRDLCTKMAEIPAMGLDGVRLKLSAACDKGNHSSPDARLVWSALDDLERFIGEALS